ncbi:hypothetical protein K6U06_19290 [Acidiferrimicrobium sp. IK]|uniref:hypothetical protein n=1 Tax=Acidiferrimicrobium sp. IK TaxID=2871700 RepID=UPI0021CB086E|nr:hypothetical protein [Acidiferrimicrobium sp. IK]MCU4186521.1 hypothetical protein [Acidiferrimicrobium sp. IK]
MIPPSSSDRLARQRLREQASRRVTNATKTLGVLSVAGAGVLGVVFTHSTHTAGRKVTSASPAAASPATAPASSGTSPTTGSSDASPATAPATTPATITPTTQAPQITYQAPVATSGGS